MDYDKIAEALDRAVKKRLDAVLLRVEEVRKQLDTLPAPIPGPKGEDGEPGVPGERGEDGKPGRDGPTPEEVVKAMDGKVADWILSYERMANERVQKFLESIPAPANGKDGRDAFSLEDIDLEIAEDGRTVKLAFQRGDERIEKSIRTSAVVYKGVFDEAQGYAKDDSVTWAGSMWIAVKEAPEGKPGTNDHWRLSVKRGRDGPAGPRGPAGEHKVVKS